MCVDAQVYRYMSASTQLRAESASNTPHTKF